LFRRADDARDTVLLSEAGAITPSHLRPLLEEHEGMKSLGFYEIGGATLSCAVRLEFWGITLNLIDFCSLLVNAGMTEKH